MAKSPHVLVIPLPLTTLNEHIDQLWSSGQWAKKVKADEMEEIGWLIKEQLRGVKIEGPVFAVYHWYCKSRRYDRDNITFARKVIQDALTAQQVIKNDGWKNIVNSFDDWFIDKEYPRVEVYLFKVEEWDYELKITSKEKDENET